MVGRARALSVGFGFLAKMLQAFLVLPGFAAAYLVAGHRRLRRRLARPAGAPASPSWCPADGICCSSSCGRSDARPYIGGSQHDSIVELALGYNGLGRLTGDETGGLGNLNFDVGWGRLFGSGMGLDIAWLLPAAVICLAAGFVITRRAPRTDPARAALILWGGWLAVTAVVFSFANGIVHPYYTVALAPAIGASIGIGATLLWRNRSDIRAATALVRHGPRHHDPRGGAVVSRQRSGCHGCGRRSPSGEWERPCCCWSPGGCPGPSPVRWRPWPSRRAWRRPRRIRSRRRPHRTAAPSRRWARRGRASAVSPVRAACLTRRAPGPALSATLSADAHDFTWVAATVGSNNAAGYQLASGAPVMAIGGFNGTDPSPTLAGVPALRRRPADPLLHPRQDDDRALGTLDAVAASPPTSPTWVETHYTPQTVDRVLIYDLTQPPRNS